MAASLSDILSTAQNLVQAINGAAKNYLNVQGAKNTAAITATTLVQQGQGRLCQISVTVAGSTTGTAYDTNLANSTNNPIYIIPMAIGLYVVNLPVGLGIVIVPGTGQALTVSFS